MTDNEYGPDKPCRRSACADHDPHRGGVHLDPRHELYDGPDTTIGALNSGPRKAARALLAAGAPVPEVVDLVEEIHRLNRQTGHLMVDKDRSVHAALARALDCTEHGKQIAELEKQVYAADESNRKTEAARTTLISGLHEVREFVTALGTRARTGGELPAVPELVTALTKALDKISAAHNRRWKA